jgi:hypothetical protein
MARQKADAIDAILELVASGQTLSEACREPGMPSRSTIYARIDSDQDYAQRYERALERGGDAVADFAHHIAANTNRENASANRVILDALKWRASRLNSRYAPPSGADGAPDGDVPRPDVEAARARLLSRFDEIAERVEGFDRDHHWVSQLVANAIRTIEDRQQIDPLLEGDCALILATVQATLMPHGTNVPNGKDNANDANEGAATSGTNVPPEAVAALNSAPHAEVSSLSSSPAAPVEAPTVPGGGLEWQPAAAAWVARR